MGKRPKGSNDYIGEGELNFENWKLHYLNMILEMAVTRFQWVNLPDEIDERVVESIIMREGRAVFYRTPEGIYTVASLAQGGGIDNNWNPTLNFPVVPNPDKKVSYGGDESVVIYNNFARLGIYSDIYLYACDLAELTMTSSINIYNQRTTKLVGADNNTQFNVKSIMDGRDKFAKLLFVNLENLEDLKTLDLTSPYVADKIQIMKEKKWNEIMAFLGINNNNVNKAERVQSAEVRANNEQVLMHMLSYLKAREQAVKKINKMFGLNIQVKPREYQFQLENPDYERDDSGVNLKGGEDNG